MVELVTWSKNQIISSPYFVDRSFWSSLLLGGEVLLLGLLELLTPNMTAPESPVLYGFAGGTIVGIVLALLYDIGLVYVAILVRLTDPGLSSRIEAS